MRERLTIVVLASAILVAGVGSAQQVHPGGAEKAKAGEGDCCVGERSLGVEVTSDGEPLENTRVTVVDKRTGSQVFSGYTDSAGQINVTLPQGQYTVVAQGQSKTINLNRDQTVQFDLDDDERPQAR